ncbi:MAG: BON domain-containing protein [Vicinamibacteria bacterium]|nr:BON domain-containing protein [Vicinamibacteria bacterium]
MNMNKTLGVALLGVLVVSTVGARTTYAESDAWVGTKAKIALLTTDGAGRTAVKMDIDNGKVTLHGKVESQAVKDKAEASVRKVDGVTSVKNLVQVVPESMEKAIKATDKEVKDGVESALKGKKTLENVHVDSVDNGVVLLSGKTATWELSLLAIETADRVPGARRVASLIESDQK